MNSTGKFDGCFDSCPDLKGVKDACEDGIINLIWWREARKTV